MTAQANNHSLIEALQAALQHNNAWGKLHAGLSELQNSDIRKTFFYLFAIVPRWFKVRDPQFALPEKLDPYRVMAEGNLAQMARLYLILKLDEFTEAEEYHATINELFQTADVNEQISLVQSLQFIPHAEMLVERAREAARSNIESVFSAVAHRTHYAQRYFDNAGWDQLVLKAAFLAVPIWNIVGLRERNNTRLVTMLCDYVKERQAADRSVPWDLFCCPGWLANSENALQFLEDQFKKGPVKIKQAIHLALQENTHATAQTLATQLAAELKQPLGNWQSIAELQDQEVTPCT